MQLINTGSEGVILQDLGLPVVANEVTWADPEDGEGRRPLRKVPTSPTGSITVAVSAYDEAPFWDYVDNLQGLIASMDSSSAATIEVRLGHAAPVTYDVTLIALAGMPVKGTHLPSHVVEGCTIEFESMPYGRLDPVEIFVDQELEGPVGMIEISDVPGHVDAFADLRLNDASGESRSHVEIGVSLEYDPDESLSVGLPDLDFDGTTGASATRAGSISANVARAALAGSPSAVCKSGPLAHVGRKRIRARVWASTAYVQVRLAWRIGDGAFRAEDWVTVPLENDWADVLLSVIEVRRVVSGLHSWEARIDARAVEGSATIDVDFIRPFPADIFARAGSGTPYDGNKALATFDLFGSTSGGLVAETSTSLHTWAHVGGVSDTTDFTAADAPDNAVIRSATGDDDTDIRHACIVLLGDTDRTDVSVAATVTPVVYYFGPEHAYCGVVARCADNDNFIAAVRRRRSVHLFKVTGGTVEEIGYWSAGIRTEATGKLSLDVLASGKWSISCAGALIKRGFDEDFRLGGALEAGRSGLIDWYAGLDSGARTYRDFGESVPAVDEPAIHSGRSMLITHNAALRESADGARMGSSPEFRGQYLRIPPATRAKRKIQLVVSARRNDVDDGLPDDGLTDELTASLTVTPRVLLLPGP